MSKKYISALLVFVMILSLLPVGVLADTGSAVAVNGYVSNYPAGDKNMYVTQRTDRVVAPGITEQDIFLNDGDGSDQVAGCMMTIDLSGGNVKIKATYKGFYNGTDSSKWSVDKWGMQTIREQAEAYEASTGEKVVAATNADYFNMQTGQPLGVLIMNGVNCNPAKVAAEPYFAILKDGTAVIRDAGTPVDDVAEAVSSPFYLVKNGVNVRSPGENSLIPGNSIGIDDQGRIRTFVADGRQTPYSRGITIYELAEFWEAQGMKDVLYLDGGGSATLLTNADDGSGLELRNSPSDGYERTVSSGLLFVTTAAPASGKLDHADIYCSADSIPAGASVQFCAQGVDTAGYGCKLDHSWALDASSSGMGSIDADGLFLSNGKMGTAKINLISGGKVLASKTVTVTSASTAGFTGLVSVSGGTKFLINGDALTDWFMVGHELHHTGSDGILHNTTTRDTRTCLGNGYYEGRCQCGKTLYGQALWSIGHKWNENHVCVRCGARGIDIHEVKLPAMKFYTYTGKQITPSVNYLTYDGRTLDFRSGRSGKDGYLSFGENVNVGIGTMTIEGRGNFYGTLEIDFYIIPGAIKSLAARDVSYDSATLYWDAAPGATSYIVEKNVGGTWQTIATTSDTSYRVTGLSAGADNEFRVAWKATLDKTYTTSISSRPTVTVSTPMDIVCTLACGQTVSVTGTDKGNYVFLPAGTDLSKLVITIPGNPGTVLSGDKGSAKAGESFDLTKVSSLKNGEYTLSFTVGGGKSTIKLMAGDSIGTMYLTSDDAENQGREYVDAEKGNKTTGKMTLIAADGSTVIFDGALTQLKSRGNSSFTYSPKKAYQIKLDSKSDLLGNGEKGKTWVLLANYMDPTSFHDKLMKDLAKEMGMEGTPDCNWVNLYYDGEYCGVYLLSEKASIGSTTVDITDMEDAYKEVNEGYGDNEVSKTAKNTYGNEFKYTEGLTEPADISGGYLIELNGTRGIDEANGFKTAQKYEGKNYTFNVKSPEFAGKAAMEYISGYFQEFEDAVYAQDKDGNFTGFNEKTGKYFYEYCDMESLVKMFLLQHIAASPDAFYASLYFYKDAGGLMYAGPLWDMDLSLGTGMDADISASNSFVTGHRYLSDALIQIPAFQKALREYFGEFETLVQKVIDTGIDGYADILDGNIAMNHVLWDFIRSGNPNSDTHLFDGDVSYDSIVTNAKNWLKSRLSFTEKVVTHEHSYKLTGVKAATCDESGYTGDMACVTCRAVREYGRKTQAPGHQIITVDAKEATETENGYTGDTICSVCKEVLSKGEVIPAKGIAKLPFEDVAADAYYAAAVAWAVANKVTMGVDETHFMPDRSCTRANVVTFLWRAAGEPAPQNPNNPFTDVDESAYYYNAVLWAVEKGIVSGYDDGTFRPNAACTRAHVVTFLWRYENKPAASKEVNITDLAGLNADFTAAIKWAASEGVVAGYDDGTFRPNAGCTRAHVVAFLQRDLDK